MVKNPQFVDQISKARASRVRSLYTSMDLPNTREEMLRTPQEELGKDQDMHRLRMKKLKAANFHLTMVKYKVQRLEKVARLQERNKRKARAGQHSMKLEDKEIDSKPKAILRDRRTRIKDFKLDKRIMRYLTERYIMHLEAIHFNAVYYDFLMYLVSGDYEHLCDDKDGLLKKLEEIHQAPALPDYMIGAALITYNNLCSMFIGYDKEKKKIRRLQILDNWKGGMDDSLNRDFFV